MDSEGVIQFREPILAMQIFLSAFDAVPDPRAENSRHELGELLVIAFVSVLCGATSCAEMAAFGRAKESVFKGFLKLKHAIPSHDTFSATLRMIDPKALDAAFGKVLADVAALLKDGDVIAIDGKALRGARCARQGREREDAHDGLSLCLAAAPDAGHRARRPRHGTGRGH